MRCGRQRRGSSGKRRLFPPEDEHALWIGLPALDPADPANPLARPKLLVGDTVLREFSQTLTRMLRASDLLARYGGEEFLVVLGNSGIDAASAVIRRILEEVSRTPMAIVEGTPLYVTFSAGLATHGEHERFGNARELLNV